MPNAGPLHRSTPQTTDPEDLWEAEFLLKLKTSTAESLKVPFRTEWTQDRWENNGDGAHTCWEERQNDTERRRGILQRTGYTQHGTWAHSGFVLSITGWWLWSDIEIFTVQIPPDCELCHAVKSWNANIQFLNMTLSCKGHMHSKLIVSLLVLSSFDLEWLSESFCARSLLR